MSSFNEEFRFGSAALAAEAEIEDAGLLSPRGLMLGYHGERQLRIEGDAPLITFGGAGSGKLRDVIAYNVCGARNSSGAGAPLGPLMLNDPRGELAAISWANQARFEKPAYLINPAGLHGLPSHATNPMDILTPDSPTVHIDSQLFTVDLIEVSGSAEGQFFELRAREWTEKIIKSEVFARGGITLPRLYEIINAIEGGGWDMIAEEMLHSPFDDVRRAAAEMDMKRSDAPKEYGAVMGEIFKSLNFLSVPAVRDSLRAPDFSLKALCEQNCVVYVMIPAEFAGLLAPMQRVLFGTAMLYKFRASQAPRITLLVDEAAQLGRFESLLRAYTYGRGMGIRTWSIWQDTGQIARHYGPNGLSAFIGSSQVRQFFGIRDLQSAETVSRMIGTQTLEYDDVPLQARARLQSDQAIHAVLSGADPFEVVHGLAYSERLVRHRSKQHRQLITPDEVLNMPENRQVLFVSGHGLHPIYAHKYPYWTRREMAGAYLPNPYHPPLDSVVVRERFMSRQRRVITERVPERYAHLPQHQSGYWSYIEGYRP